RERLHAEPEPEELLLECLESLQLVAERCRPLELQAGGARFHLAPQRLDRTVIGAIQEGTREREPVAVLPLAARPDAGPEAFSELVAQAPRGPRRELEELLLVGEVHLPLHRAVAEAQHIVELPHRL